MLFDKYVAYPLREAEYVGSVRKPVEEVRTDLVDLGYEFGYLSSLKYHWETDDPDQGSYRRIDPANERWQWHVHLFERGDSVELSSHYEYRPDVRRIAGETHSERIERLREHYRPTWNVGNPDGEPTYFLGRQCEQIEAYVDGDPSG